MLKIGEEKRDGSIASSPRSPNDSAPLATFFDSSWKRFQYREEEQGAILVLDAGGEIQELTTAARQLLEYDPGQPITGSFFAHVHAKDLYRVVRDVAEMTCHGRQEASWMLRLRTGQGDWHWFNAVVGNQLDQPDQAIFICLKDPVA